MATFTELKLSGSTDGKAILVAATATAGDTVHTAHASALDEIILYATNNHTASVLLTLEWGEATAPNGNIQFTVPFKDGLYLVVPGLVLTNSLVLKAFAATTNVISLHGKVHRIT